MKSAKTGFAMKLFLTMVNVFPLIVSFAFCYVVVSVILMWVKKNDVSVSNVENNDDDHNDDHDDDEINVDCNEKVKDAQKEVILESEAKKEL